MSDQDSVPTSCTDQLGNIIVPGDIVVFAKGMYRGGADIGIGKVRQFTQYQATIEPLSSNGYLTKITAYEDAREPGKRIQRGRHVKVRSHYRNKKTGETWKNWNEYYAATSKLSASQRMEIQSNVEAVATEYKDYVKEVDGGYKAVNVKRNCLIFWAHTEDSGKVEEKLESDW